MDSLINAHELQERLALIETMIAEGRRKTESWGWTFVLWGFAYFVAIIWSGWAQVLLPMPLLAGNRWAWPATMLGTAALTLLIGLKIGQHEATNTLSRTISSVWMGVGGSMLVIFPALSIAGRLDTHLFVALVAVMLGGINAASAMILGWKLQFACAVVWWLTSAAACFGSERQLLAVFLSALFLCQIVFGVYVMIRDGQARREVRHG
jgi:ABC-type enterochelin transport system permease subunit